jgi:hypothetical protein
MHVTPSIRCCAALLLGWVFSFTCGVIFKLFFTLFLASFPLSVWFEREYAYRRRLDDLYERVGTLQHHIAVSLTILHARPVIYNVHSVLAVESGYAQSCQ